MNTDTIVALATAPGRGGIGVIRLSGSKALDIAGQLGAADLEPRLAKFCRFSIEQQAVDSGLAIAFIGPHSFTGENVVELQAHGSPVTLKRLIKHCVALGARLAEPGEFSQRAFLNDRIDLSQAEAIADLIAASSEKAASAAMKSLEGSMSDLVAALAVEIIELRKFVEAAIDFAEEEIDFLSDGKLLGQLEKLISKLQQCLDEGSRSQKLLQGINLVILGAPNAGKSSLLNRLAGSDRAIVTDIAGTTRDTLSETIDLDGLAVTITDTAGLNSNPDRVEAIGIERALASAKSADHLLVLFDESTSSLAETQTLLASYGSELPALENTCFIANKIDLSDNPQASSVLQQGSQHIRISAKQGFGLELLLEHLKNIAGHSDTEPRFYARQRHLDALALAMQHAVTAETLLVQNQAGELVAEELKMGHLALQSITGVFSTDDLLGEIFSSFCVGK